MSFKYDKVRDALVTFIRNNVEGKDVAVAFSGGLDSGLVSAIAKEYANSVTLYTCGTNTAYDVVNAKDLAETLGLPWVHVPISKWTVEFHIRDLITATKVSDPFTISYELPLFCVCKEMKEKLVLSGQGADEYFMGCAKFVDQSNYDYEMLKKAAVERLMDVSVPCEQAIAEHFGQTLIYPYLDPSVVEEVEKLNPDDLRPKDLDSRKIVLKEIAIDLNHPYLAEKKKKSSQYGSGTTDIVRILAKERGRMFNEYIGAVYDEVVCNISQENVNDYVVVRMDSDLKKEAEAIMHNEGVLPAEAMELFYRRVIEDKNLQFVKKESEDTDTLED